MTSSEQRVSKEKMEWEKYTRAGTLTELHPTNVAYGRHVTSNRVGQRGMSRRTEARGGVATVTHVVPADWTSLVGSLARVNDRTFGENRVANATYAG